MLPTSTCTWEVKTTVKRAWHFSLSFLFYPVHWPYLTWLWSWSWYSWYWPSVKQKSGTSRKVRSKCQYKILVSTFREKDVFYNDSQDKARIFLHEFNSVYASHHFSCLLPTRSIKRKLTQERWQTPSRQNYRLICRCQVSGTYRVGQKTDCLLKVWNSRIYWHGIVFYTPNCSIFYPE